MGPRAPGGHNSNYDPPRRPSPQALLIPAAALATTAALTTGRRFNLHVDIRITITETAAPADYNKDATPQTVVLDFENPTGSATNPFVNHKPDAYVKITPNSAQNSIKDAHTFQIEVGALPGNGGTVSFESIKAAASDPVKALKNE